MPSQQSDTPDERKVSKVITMFKITMGLMSIMLLITAICFLIYLLQTDPGNQSEHGGHAGPALFDTPLTSRVILSDLKLWARAKREVSGQKGSGSSEATPEEHEPRERRVVSVDYTTLKPQDLIERATGFSDSNIWLDWMAQNAREQKVANCVACASARPRLFIEPAPLYPDDQWGYDCMLRMTRGAVNTGNCTVLSSLFPPIGKLTQVGPFMPRKDNYTCFTFSTDKVKYRLGEIDPSWCSVTQTGRTTNNVSDAATLIGTWARSGLYYYCGHRTLLVRVPLGSVGTCAMVRLGAPLMLIGNQVKAVPPHNTRTLAARRKRHILRKRGIHGTHAYDPRMNSPTWIDSIGVPRGVPNEFKLVDQIAAGFENIPIISSFFPVTPNKNVDRINYVHYNVLRLSNLTRDGMEGLAEQVGPTSLMGVQNRMALDMLLAEKGGVCSMFGDQCCTFIPNNTAPDGSVTRALEGLKSLSETMHDHSGVDNPLEGWLTSVFGRWKGVMVSVMLSLSIVVGIMVTCCCCLIPCARRVSESMFVRAVDPRVITPMSMMPMMNVELNV
ncbi:uncharacterized protein LOC113035110 [Astatotilapia calliptera]|uniref:uncharacterized protein LOC113035110 n=1 Tax=Astatotilapia calliptera TaxID=8154 RepID=UPI000E42290F|nr:uncharacterized protein LOC113035110 [Astatotilapia calliptera]